MPGIRHLQFMFGMSKHQQCAWFSSAKVFFSEISKNVCFFINLNMAARLQSLSHHHNVPSLCLLHSLVIVQLSFPLWYFRSWIVSISRPIQVSSRAKRDFVSLPVRTLYLFVWRTVKFMLSLSLIFLTLFFFFLLTVFCEDFEFFFFSFYPPPALSFFFTSIMH